MARTEADTHTNMNCALLYHYNPKMDNFNQFDHLLTKNLHSRAKCVFKLQQPRPDRVKYTHLLNKHFINKGPFTFYVDRG